VRDSWLQAVILQSRSPSQLGLKPCCLPCTWHRSVIVRFKEGERDESLKDKAQGMADKARENLQQAAGKVGSKANVDNVSAARGACPPVGGGRA
jgi:hypothetical protein